MFDIGMTEMLVIAVVTIIVVGPKDLPGMLRNIGKYVSQLRSMAREFQGQMDSALKEAELDGVKNTLDDIRDLNPVNQVKKEVTSYMDSARSLDVPDDDSSDWTPQAIDTGVPDEEPEPEKAKPAKKAAKTPANDAGEDKVVEAKPKPKPKAKAAKNKTSATAESKAV